MNSRDNILYADVEQNSDDFFVVTPEGNYYNFPCDKFSENSDDITIVDTKSHIPYVVKFHD